MSSSLHHLLADEGFPKLRDKHHNQAAVPIYRNHSSGSSTSNKNTKKLGSSARNHQPVIDQVAFKAVISILSGYVGRYLKDHTFRQVIRHKCCSNFQHSKKNDYDNEALAKLELGIQSVEKIVDSHGSNRIEILKNSIKLLTSAASLNSQHSKNGESFIYVRIKAGTSDLNVPHVPLPGRPSYNLSRRTSISSSSTAK